MDRWPIPYFQFSSPYDPRIVRVGLKYAVRIFGL